MLILSRKKRESFNVGAAKITVLQLSHGQVRVGIEAPAEIPVVRTELLDRPRRPKRKPAVEAA